MPMTQPPQAVTKAFSPIGNNSTKFTGEYDGGGYSISGLTINRPYTGYIGLFGVTQSATIRNLSLTNVNITGKDRTGSLVGMTYSTTIDNSSASGSVDRQKTILVGGLVGYLYSGSIIRNSYSTASVVGSSYYIGGLVGYMYSSTILNSYSIGSVVTTNSSYNSLFWRLDRAQKVVAQLLIPFTIIQLRENQIQGKVLVKPPLR